MLFYSFCLLLLYNIIGYSYNAYTVYEYRMNFSCGHKSFTFPKSSLVYYPWLNHLFGNDTLGTPKDTLEYNLSEYLKTVPPYMIRNMVYVLTYLERAYKVKENNKHKHKRPPVLEWDYFELLEKVEHFLANGPGTTKGLDVPYSCRLCSKKSMVKIKPQFHPHHIIHNDKHSICVNCGMNWWVGSNRDAKLCPFSYSPQEGCLHEWE